MTGSGRDEQGPPSYGKRMARANRHDDRATSIAPGEARDQGKTKRWRWPVVLTMMAVVGVVGCAELSYYGQAAGGHWHLLSLRRPLDEFSRDPTTPAALRKRLETAGALRDFAVAELALPDNGSYRSYADLGRPYVVRNVFAAPELSLEPRQWCFPLLGCVGYRGYFDDAAAQRLADELRADGDDVYLADVPAYSTLGWFDDPLLNTFVNWPVGRLAELLFHELAHQRLFIAGDTVFNESFATAVGRLGARRWLERHGTAEERDEYENFLRRQEQFLTLVLAMRGELERFYASNQDAAAKRSAKNAALAELRARYQALKQSWGGFAGYDRWFNQDLNNAKLAAIHSYNHYVPAFTALFEQSGGDFAVFHAAAEELGELAPTPRRAALQALLDKTSPAEMASR